MTSTGRAWVAALVLPLLAAVSCNRTESHQGPDEVGSAFANRSCTFTVVWHGDIYVAVTDRTHTNPELGKRLPPGRLGDCRSEGHASTVAVRLHAIAGVPPSEALWADHFETRFEPAPVTSDPDR
jgi:hypothetical protein